jgi:hypothetical protein
MIIITNLGLLHVNHPLNQSACGELLPIIKMSDLYFSSKVNEAGITNEEHTEIQKANMRNMNLSNFNFPYIVPYVKQIFPVNITNSVCRRYVIHGNETCI